MNSYESASHGIKLSQKSTQMHSKPFVLFWSWYIVIPGIPTHRIFLGLVAILKPYGQNTASHFKLLFSPFDDILVLKEKPQLTQKWKFWPSTPCPSYNKNQLCITRKVHLNFWTSEIPNNQLRSHVHKTMSVFMSEHGLNFRRSIKKHFFRFCVACGSKLFSLLRKSFV